MSSMGPTNWNHSVATIHNAVNNILAAGNYFLACFPVLVANNCLFAFLKKKKIKYVLFRYVMGTL